jgi:hypothetical protein
MGGAMQEVAELTVGVLTVDACVIEEQPEHLVIAARVPKALIAENLPFFAALAEQSAAQPPRNARGDVFRVGSYPTSRKPRITRQRAIVGAFATAAVCLWFVAVPLTARTKPPLTALAAVLETPVVESGGKLSITLTTHRSRLCKADIDRVILRSDETTVWRTRVSGLGQAVTDEPITRKVVVPLPDGLPDGKYIYRSVTYSECPDGDFSLPIPDLHFEIKS